MRDIKFLYILLAAFSFGCGNQAKTSKVPNSLNTMSITKARFGSFQNNEEVFKYTLKNSQGMEVDIITLGGIITRWIAPDINNEYQDVVLGFDTLEPYLNEHPYFGAIIGRYGNRIAGGSFTLNKKKYTLAINNGKNHLHGGLVGFDKVLWESRTNENENGVSLILNYLSKDGEEGYPGNLDVTVTYTLKENNSLEVEYEATTDQLTVVNLTQHTYFNLSGSFIEDVLDHEVTINADAFLQVDENLIPTGKFQIVENTPFDFRKPFKIGKRINNDDEQIVRGGGYDHNWVLNKHQDGLVMAASAYDQNTGRVLDVYTTEPGMQFYTANFLDGSLKGKNGVSYGKRSAFCFETQHFPDSPNQPDFPSVELNPGEKYQSKTVFVFSTKR